MKAVIEVWPDHQRCWLKIKGYTVGQALSVPDNLVQWARDKISSRILGIDRHVEKLRNQIEALHNERDRIGYYEYSPDDFFHIDKAEGL